MLFDKEYRTGYIQMHRDMLCRKKDYHAVENHVFTDNMICMKELTRWMNDCSYTASHNNTCYALYMQLTEAMIAMPNASFTRDEVILTLDVIYFSEEERLTKNSRVIADLCTLLQDLPIHPIIGRPENFRNAAGVSDEIYYFKAERSGKPKSSKVGQLFHKVADEYKENKDALHQIAECIRNNRELLKISTIGSTKPKSSFPEGALLEYLHTYLECRDGDLTNEDRQCEICRKTFHESYKVGNSLLEKHLVVEPANLNYKKKYLPDCFITVCPNCHAALHRYRPWLTKENCAKILC